jgi:adenylate kinase family enzyme
MNIPVDARRILLIGPGGAGKTTLAVELGKRLELPVVHLDNLFWSGSWEPMAHAPWDATIARLVAEPAWIMDGNYSRTIAQRAPRADAILWLDLSPWICLGRVIQRQLRYFGRARPGLPTECRERVTPEFLGWIWTYRKRRRPAIARQLAEVAPTVPVIRLTTPTQVRTFLSALPSRKLTTA